MRKKMFASWHVNTLAHRGKLYKRSNVLMLKRFSIFTWVLLPLLSLLLTTPLAGAQSVTSIFDIDAGVRPLGMGGAFTGLADDEHALFYNPAGLAALDRIRFNSLYEGRFGASYGDLAIASRSLGVGVLFFSLGGITQYDEQDQPGGTFNYGSFALIGSFGFRPSELPIRLVRVPKIIAMGLNTKFYQVNTLEGGRGSGLALDSSLMLDLSGARFGPVRKLRFGVLIENLLSLGVKYGSGHTEPWSMGLRLGASASPVTNLILAADLESDGTFHLGSEYKYAELGLGVINLRAGAMLRGGLALTIGLGLEIRYFQVDYAFIAYPQAPDTHRLSVALDLTSLLGLRS